MTDRATVPETAPPTEARDRRRFLAAVALFVAWVLALGALAVFSGRSPVERPAGNGGQ